MRIFNKTKTRTFIFIAIGLAFFVFAPVVLATDCNKANTPAQKAKCGLNQTAGQGYADGPVTTVEGTPNGVLTSIPTAIGKVVGAILAFVGIGFFILMIYGGFLWMFARGNEQEVTKAKDLIQSAVIGLIIVLAAYALTAYVGEVLTLTR